MPRIHTATTGLVGKVNRTVILELLRQHGPATRTQITEMSGLSAATVNRLMAALARERLIVLDAYARSTGGRPPRMYRYNARLESVVAIDVGASEISGAVADLEGNLLHRETRPTQTDTESGRGEVQDVLTLAEDLVAESVSRHLRPRGVAAGVPSVVRPSGVVEWAPALGWRELALGELLEGQLGLPAFVENDVNLLALGEHRRGAGVGTHTMVALAIEAGLGGGLIIEGQLFRGANSSAGEVGYLLTAPGSLDRIYPGFGDLESRIAGNALADLAAAIGIRGGSRAALALGLFRAAAGGDSRATAILDDVVDLLALAAGNIGSLLDPELIVIGGSVVQPIEPVVEGVRQRLVGRVPHPPRIAAGILGRDAVLAGAAALAIERTSDYAFLRAPNPDATRLVVSYRRTRRPQQVPA